MGSTRRFPTSYQEVRTSLAGSKETRANGSSQTFRYIQATYNITVDGNTAKDIGKALRDGVDDGVFDMPNGKSYEFSGGGFWRLTPVSRPKREGKARRA